MKIFETKAALVAARLTAGQIVETKGYPTSGDGGAGRYLVKTAAQATADGDTVDEVGAGFTLANGNVAVLQAEPTPERFGVIFDGSTNNNTAYAAYYSYLSTLDALVNEDAVLTTAVNVAGGPASKIPIVWKGVGGSALFSVGDNQELSDLNIDSTGPLSIVSQINGKAAIIKDMVYSHTEADTPTTHMDNLVRLVAGADYPLITNNLFNRGRYSIIQNSGEACYGIRAIGNTSIDCENDFVLQNNDFQDGITHSWLVVGNYADQTNNGLAYGQTESRGIGFTTCYGGIAVANAMVACKGDGATHLENIQETMFIGNYYRDNETDVLPSGLSNRRLIRLNVTGGSVAVGQTITDSGTGATGEVLFWFPVGSIAQVINTSGTFTDGNAFTTDGGASGTITHVDPVQVHSNHIGNIYHKTTDDTDVSYASSGGPYTARNFLIGNAWNNQAAYGTKTALGTAAKTDTVAAFNSFRGWAWAQNAGGGTSSRVHSVFNNFWGNQINVRSVGTLVQFSWFYDKFFDGEFSVANLQESTIEGCTFFAGEIDIQSSTNDNIWKYNKVDSSVTLTNLSVLDFKEWESTPYTKRDRSHTVRRSNITPSSGTPVVLATLTPRAPETSVSINANIAFRNGGANRYGAGFERVQVVWNASTVPTISADPANYNPDGGVTLSLVDIGGGVVEVRALGATASGWIAEVEATLIESGVNVEPAEFIDVL